MKIKHFRKSFFLLIITITTSLHLHAIDYHNQIQTEVAQAKSAYIEYSDGKTLFYRSSGIDGFLAMTTGMISFICIGNGCLFGLLAKTASSELDKNILTLPAVGMTALGVGFGLISLGLLSTDKYTKPYMIFDDNGIIYNRKYVLAWEKLEKINIVRQGMIQFSILFKDASDNTLLNYSVLKSPLPLDNLATLLQIASLYQKQAHDELNLHPRLKII